MFSRSFSVGTTSESAGAVAVCIIAGTMRRPVGATMMRFASPLGEATAMVHYTVTRSPGDWDAGWTVPARLYRAVRSGHYGPGLVRHRSQLVEFNNQLP